MALTPSISLAVLAAAPLGAASLDLDGAELVARLGCASCHADLAPAGVREAPDLTLSSARLEREFVEAFLVDPAATHPDSRMPDLLSGRGDAGRAEAAEALSAYVMSLARGREDFDEVGDAARGERIYHRVGCVQCHGPRAAAPGTDGIGPMPEGGRALDHVAGKYLLDGLAAFLARPLAHRPAGLMPDMQLTRGEAADLAAYLTGGGRAAGDAPGGADDTTVAAGRALFSELGCASCHRVPGAAAPPARPAIRAVDAGCLAPEPPAGAPDYRLDADERAALAAAVAGVWAPRDPAAEIAATMRALRCTACHERAGEGGVPEALDAYLTTDEPELGDAARRPPRLDGVGGKLRRAWTERVLYDGASVRPYMHTRMPVFGVDQVAHLPELLEEVDAAEPLELAPFEGEEEREARDGARLLLGSTRLGCVTCHTFNGREGPAHQGLDLLTTPERLRERWFRDFLLAPESELPGVVMPQSWPGGVAVDDETLGGDTDRQIRAIWHYLRLGTSAANPRGIDQPRWLVDVEGAPRTYRGRSRVAGFRGIAVGFPEGLHYAFNANNGALAALWRGDFLSVNWNGQGAGDFSPRSRAAELARDVALLERVADDEPWPLAPVKTEEAPVNPDPTYPRQHGYRFSGYRMDEGGVPTLRYSVGDVMVEDRTAPVGRGDGFVLGRTLSFETSAPAALTFRALAGEVEDLGEGRFRSGRVTIELPGVSTRLRTFEGGVELLVDIDLEPGTQALEVILELAD